MRLSGYGQQTRSWLARDATIPKKLITRALQRTFLAQLPASGLVVHSDRSWQYCSNAYRTILHRHEAVRSQRWRGKRYDNALPSTTRAERLWPRLKTEKLELRKWPVFADLADAQASIADYFDHHNHDQLHSGINYQTPHHTHQ